MSRDVWRVRADRVWGVARRDWRTELKGPQGAWLPIVMAALLVPSSTAPLPRAMVATEAQMMTVSGDVPEEVEALRGAVRRVRRFGQLRFEQRDGVLYTSGDDPPPSVRAVLDRDDGTDITLHQFTTGFVFPGRSILFALISASTLTGAISASIGGERSNGTLTTLLAAAISRLEIVLGKLVAWGGLGAFTALGAALLAIGLDRIDGGAWLLPLPLVPIATAALGLWLVRRATDVVSASTTLIRVLPVLLVTSGIVAWLFGSTHPLLGALVPIGGALVAAGDTWPGLLAPLVATGSAALFTAFCVVGTARELESPSNGAAATQEAIGIAALVAAGWWIPVVTPLLWAEAGNFRVTQEIPVEAGVLAGALSFAMVVVVSTGREADPIEALGLARPTLRQVGLGIAASPVVLAIQAGLVGWLQIGASGFVGRAGARLAATAFPPTPEGLAVLVVIAEEVLFRGWLARRVGPVATAVVYAIVKLPLDPLGGIAMATVLGALGHRGGPLASMTARLIALGVLWWLA